MRIFKEVLEHDAAVIMSVVEFAEYLTVDGVILPCQFVKSSGEVAGGAGKQFEGLHGDKAQLYFKTRDYVGKRRTLPKQGEIVTLELKDFAKKFTVVSCEEELGVTCLTLSAYRQGVPRKIPQPVI